MAASYIIRKRVDEASFPSVPSGSSMHTLKSTAGNLRHAADELESMRGSFSGSDVDKIISILNREIQFLGMLKKSKK